MTTLQKLKEKIHLANPDKKWSENVGNWDESATWKEVEIPVRLADVLLAMKGNTRITLQLYKSDKLIITRISSNFSETIKTFWDLTTDLDAQSTECIDFISKVLGV